MEMIFVLLDLFQGNPPFTGGFHSQRASNAELWWFLCHWPDHNIEWWVKLPVIRDNLTHWGRVTHICVTKLTTIGSDNSLSPGRRQAIIWTNAGILLMRPLGTNFNEMLIEILTFSFMKMRFKSVVCEMASILSRPQCVNTHVMSL